ERVERLQRLRERDTWKRLAPARMPGDRRCLEAIRLAGEQAEAGQHPVLQRPADDRARQGYAWLSGDEHAPHGGGAGGPQPWSRPCMYPLTATQIGASRSAHVRTA